MRITTAGIDRHGEGFTFDFDGTPVTAWPGESLAAALTSAGITAMRQTRQGEQRGVYCGMGVCGECAVLVDGVQRRSCLEPARPGLHVAPMPALAPIAAQDAGAAPAATVLTPDILVIGAGPAGLSAARVAAAAGCDVLIVDERAKAGGQYFKQPGLGFAVTPGGADAQFTEGAALAAAASAAGARLLPGATVWGAFAVDHITAATADAAYVIRARRVIVAPGAYERPHPVPGWTLPGAMTTGAAQTLLRAYQTAPGRRVLVAGNGPLNLQVARELTRAGVEVVAVAELARRPGIGDFPQLAAMAAASPALVRDGIGHVAALARAGVPVRYGHVLTRIEGDGRVERAAIARIDGRGRLGAERWFDVDAVCSGYGFLPQSEIGRALGCAHDAAFPSGLVARRDAEGRSTVPEVFIVGDAGGLGGARVAIAQGEIAGLAAARDLGAAAPAGADAAARRLLVRHGAFQRALWQLYRPVAATLDLADATTQICRCEAVDRAAIDALLDGGIATLGSLKRASRAGMGRCQGRYCGATLAALIAGRGGDAIASDAYFAPRTPFKPVVVAHLAAAPDPLA
jgi:NADPH-dependent 2,4-dienoyl-CoA reductase/sulfur reductase-like enzyme